MSQAFDGAAFDYHAFDVGRIANLAATLGQIAFASTSSVPAGATVNAALLAASLVAGAERTNGAVLAGALGNLSMAGTASSYLTGAADALLQATLCAAAASVAIRADLRQRLATLATGTSLPAQTFGPVRVMRRPSVPRVLRKPL